MMKNINKNINIFVFQRVYYTIVIIFEDMIKHYMLSKLIITGLCYFILLYMYFVNYFQADSLEAKVIPESMIGQT